MLRQASWPRWLVVSRLTGQSDPPTRLLTVTSLPGAEDDPSLSQDGNWVAFSWAGSNANGNGDIWVKAVDGDAMRQLTDTPDATEKFPQWSPDGQYIAFTRLANNRSSVWMVSALGGQERLIAERSGYTSWLPDGKSLIVVSRSPEGRLSLVQHVLSSGVQQELTEAPEGFSEAHPKVSPTAKP